MSNFGSIDIAKDHTQLKITYSWSASVVFAVVMLPICNPANDIKASSSVNVVIVFVVVLLLLDQSRKIGNSVSSNAFSVPSLVICSNSLRDLLAKALMDAELVTKL